MSKKVDAIKKVAVALGYGEAVTDYTSRSIVGVLKEMAVKMQCATSVEDIHSHKIDGVLEHIAANYGTEEVEPYDLTITKTHASATVKRRNKNLNTGKDQLWNGDKLTITAAGDTGYDLTTLTVNGTTITSGSTVTVDSHNITLVATGTLQTFDLERTATNCTVTVTKGGNAVSDGEGVLTYGDVITISATEMEGCSTPEIEVNGEVFVSGSTHTVSSDVEIVATSEAEGEVS